MWQPRRRYSTTAVCHLQRVADFLCGRISGLGAPRLLAAIHYARSFGALAITRNWAAASPLMSCPEPLLLSIPSGTAFTVDCPWDCPTRNRFYCRSRPLLLLSLLLLCRQWEKKTGIASSRGGGPSTPSAKPPVRNRFYLSGTAVPSDCLCPVRNRFYCRSRPLLPLSLLLLCRQWAKKLGLRVHVATGRSLPPRCPLRPIFLLRPRPRMCPRPSIKWELSNRS